MRFNFQVLHISLVLLISLLTIQCNSQNNNKPQKITSDEWRLVWQDEFENEGVPNPNNWVYDLGSGCPNLCGWGNSELQFYTDDPKNVNVKDGVLSITALRDTIEGRYFSSARIKTKYKFDFKYGKVEVRAKNPSGIGSWPAIWMLPTDNEYGGWPKSGEIDIMEHVGFDKDSIFGTVHTEAFNHMRNTHKSGSIFIENNEEEFHIYGIEWDEKKINFMVDDQVYFTFNNENKSSAEWPYDQDFHIILNLAVGGTWGGQKGIDNEGLPWEFVIDFVRVYQRN